MVDSKEDRGSCRRLDRGSGWRKTSVAVGVLAVVAALIATAVRLAPLSASIGDDEVFVDTSPTEIGQDSVASSRAHPLEATLETARRSLQHVREHVADYTAVLVKRERIGGQLTDHQFAKIKVRNRKVDGDRVIVPLSVYMRFLKPRSVEGREVIWVEGWNDGRLVAHEGGFKNLLTVKLDPQNPLAMLGQRYPITDIGIENLLAKLIEKGERDLEHGECKVQIFKGAKVESRVCTMIQVTHPIRRRHFDFFQARIFLDDELQVPIRYASWSWPTTADGDPILEEEYTYLKLQINVGLSDRDFDPANPQYDFR